MEERAKRLRELEAELSPRHLRFARLVAAGEMNLADCYAEVYPTGANRKGHSNSACRLLGKKAVAEYVELLSGEVAETFIVNRHELIGDMLDFVGMHKDNDKASNAVASTYKTLLDALTPKEVRATRIEVTGKDGGPVKSEVRQKGLSPEMARSIVKDTLGLTADQARRMLGESEDADGEET